MLISVANVLGCCTGFRPPPSQVAACSIAAASSTRDPACILLRVGQVHQGEVLALALCCVCWDLLSYSRNILCRYVAAFLADWSFAAPQTSALPVHRWWAARRAAAPRIQ